MLPEAELLLFAAARAQIVREKLRPALKAGKVVLCDRFVDSTTVYQGVARGLNRTNVAAVNQVATGGLQPDLTILIDLPADIGLQRARLRANGQLDRMEQEDTEFYEAVRQGYLELATKPNRTDSLSSTVYNPSKPSKPKSGMPFNHALPESLRDVRAVEVLERSLASGRLAHGILLHGDEMADLEAISQAVAGSLLQTDRNPLDHPDCFTLRPSGKARLIRIGESGEQNTMRQLVANLQKSANQGGNKIGILYEADRMNNQSANAFLKTLEEPGKGTTLLLLTTRPYDLLDTIRSRCLNFRVPGQAGGIAHEGLEPLGF